MAQDGDIGSNARMSYSLDDDLEESSTFIIETDPVTQEGVILLVKVNTRLFVLDPLVLHVLLSLSGFNLILQRKRVWVGRGLLGSETLLFFIFLKKSLGKYYSPC